MNRFIVLLLLLVSCTAQKQIPVIALDDIEYHISLDEVTTARALFEKKRDRLDIKTIHILENFFSLSEFKIIDPPTSTEEELILTRYFYPAEYEQKGETWTNIKSARFSQWRSIMPARDNRILDESRFEKVKSFLIRKQFYAGNAKEPDDHFYRCLYYYQIKNGIDVLQFYPGERIAFEVLEKMSLER